MGTKAHNMVSGIWKEGERNRGEFEGEERRKKEEEKKRRESIKGEGRRD